MKSKSFVAVVAAGILVASMLVACGGSGGGSPDTPETHTGTISGVAFDAELANASVAITTYDRSEYYGQTTTDNDGRFSLDVVASSDQVLRIETAGGSYIDEYTGRVDQEYFNQTRGALRLYINYAAGSSLHIAPTIYTTLSANLADYLVGQGTPISEAVVQANATLSDILGVDIETTIPHNITKLPDATVSNSSIQYGFYSAAISALMDSQDHIAPYASSIDFTEYVGADLRDDGLANESASDNVYVFSGGYRHALAMALLKMALSGRNASGLTLNDVLPLAQRLNDNTGAVFGENAAVIVPLDIDKPIVENIQWNDGDITTDTIYGTVKLSFDVGDVLGLESVTVSIDGNEYAVEDIENPSITIDTTLLSDGKHDVILAARNILGVETKLETYCYTVNHGIAITSTAPGDGDLVSGRVVVSADIHDPTGITYVEFYEDDSSISFASFDDGDVGHYEASLFTPASSDGDHKIKIRATNGVGVVTEKIINITVDNTAPTITYFLVENTYLAGESHILVFHDTDADVVLSAGSVNLSRESRTVDGDIAYSIFNFYTSTYNGSGSKTYPDGQYTLHAVATDKAGNVSTKDMPVNVDNTAPSVEITYPFDEGRITSQFNLNFLVSDSSGFGENSFEILIDGRHAAWVSSTWGSYPINPAIDGRGWHDVTLIVTDASGKVATDTVSVFFDI